MIRIDNFLFSLRYINVKIKILIIYVFVGFEVADKGCCGTGKIELVVLCNKLTPFTCSDASTHVFFDSYHPSEKAYQIITDKLLYKYLKYLNN